MKSDINTYINEKSTALLSPAQYLGLGLLGLMTIAALGLEVFGIVANGTVKLGDLLLAVSLVSLVAIRYRKNARKPNAGQDQPAKSRGKARCHSLI